MSILMESYIPGLYENGFITGLNATFNGNLTVLGTTNIAAVSLTDLTTTGNTVLGNATTDTLTVNGNSTFTGTATGTMIDTVVTGTTTGVGIDLTGNTALTTGILLSVASSATAITGAGRLAYINHTGATSTSGTIFEVASAANDETVIHQITASAANALGVASQVTTATTTGIGLNVVASSLTSGTGARVYSNSADATARNLLSVVNDNTAAVGAIPLFVQQDAVVSTNFKLVAQLGGINIYISDQTSPNTALTAPEGSICLNASATGQIAYNNDGATSWQIITSA